MLHINEHYLKLQASYLFSDIARRVAAFQEQHPEREIIKMGIGDVTNPLPPACIRAFHQAVDEMGQARIFGAMAQNKATPFCGKPLPQMIFRAGMLR